MHVDSILDDSMLRIHALTHVLMGIETSERKIVEVFGDAGFRRILRHVARCCR